MFSKFFKSKSVSFPICKILPFSGDSPIDVMSRFLYDPTGHDRQFDITTVSRIMCMRVYAYHDAQAMFTLSRALHVAFVGLHCSYLHAARCSYDAFVY